MYTCIITIILKNPVLLVLLLVLIFPFLYKNIQKCPFKYVYICIQREKKVGG